MDHKLRGRLFVVGHPEMGGAWIPQFGYYTDYDEAKAVADIVGQRVFTLRPGDKPTPSHDGCKGAYLRNSKCTRCGHGF